MTCEHKDDSSMFISFFSQRKNKQDSEWERKSTSQWRSQLCWQWHNCVVRPKKQKKNRTKRRLFSKWLVVVYTTMTTTDRPSPTPTNERRHSNNDAATVAPIRFEYCRFNAMCRHLTLDSKENNALLLMMMMLYWWIEVLHIVYSLFGLSELAHQLPCCNLGQYCVRTTKNPWRVSLVINLNVPTNHCQSLLYTSKCHSFVCLMKLLFLSWENEHSRFISNDISVVDDVKRHVAIFWCWPICIAYTVL